MNRNYPVSVVGSVRRSVAKKKTANGMKAAFLGVAVLVVAGGVLYFGSAGHAAVAGRTGLAGSGSRTSRSVVSQASFSPTVPNLLSSMPLYFEPNQGQTAPQVKFLARGAGYGLFLTSDEAVLRLQHAAASPQDPAAVSRRAASRRAGSSVIRMRLEGANSSARVFGASPLPGKSSYFVGNNTANWHRDIPQFARVQYQAVYPGIDLIYYGDQGQLEYDFHVAPSADPGQIALRFQGASARIDAGGSGDLVLSTADGEVRFQAPHVYQRDGNARKTIPGAFRQLAPDAIGFTVGNYDRSRELVIDPILTYSTFLGGSATEGFVKVAVDGALNLYLAGSTDSTDFPLTQGSETLAGSQEIFISKIYPANFGTVNSQLVYSIILGGTSGAETDTLAGIEVDSAADIYVAGTTNSSDFPTTLSNAFQPNPQVAGTHGFLSVIGAVINNNNNPPTLTYTLDYSTYLSGNGSDTVTGLAIDGTSTATFDNAYVTGTTTSTNDQSNGFPANAAGYQTVSNAAAGSGSEQFFASKINPNGQGLESVIYSTYFGGGYPVNATAIGGGIAVDPPPNRTPGIYITGTTNMQQTGGPNNLAPFPLLNDQQGCLNQASITSCNPSSGNTNTDGFVAKFNPTYQGQQSLVYSTYIGGSGSDAGNAITVDSTADAYVTGATNSSDWVGCDGVSCTYQGVNGNSNAFVAKIGNQTVTGSVFPLTYFTYLGGAGPDSGQAILVDSAQGVHVVGNTQSPAFFPTATNSYSGDGDAFLVLISTTAASGNYVYYLGGSQLDQGTGIALDTYNTTYVAGNTQSANFPVTANAYQSTLNNNSQDAFVSKFGAVSNLAVTQATGSPSPSPVNAGNQVAFTFDIANYGPDPASVVNFYANITPVNGVTTVSAKVTSGGSTGSCGNVENGIISCNIPTLAVCNTNPCPTPAQVEVDVTPVVLDNDTSVQVSGYAVANNSGSQSNSILQTVSVADFTITVSAPNPPSQIAGTSPAATISVNFCPLNTSLGYSASITPSDTITPSMVTANSPAFNPTPVILAGSGCQSTTLSIQTVARPVLSGSLLRHGAYYAAWLPIGGLSLVGLGLGARRRRGRWLIGAALGLIAGLIALQLGCGSSSTATTPTGGTAAATYTITVTGTAGAGATHSQSTTFVVH
ncbi:MAG: SBBP repeat-containing protein [Terriglobales bacterium]